MTAECSSKCWAVHNTKAFIACFPFQFFKIKIKCQVKVCKEWWLDLAAQILQYLHKPLETPCLSNLAPEGAFSDYCNLLSKGLFPCKFGSS